MLSILKHITQITQKNFHKALLYLAKILLLLSEARVLLKV